MGKRVKITGRIITKGGGSMVLDDFVSIRGDFGDPVGFNVGSDAKLKLGKDTFINKGCYFEASEEIDVGSGCFIAPKCQFYDRNGHHRDIVGTDTGITIGNDVWIGAGSIILPGSKVGSGVIIGAGSIVNGDIPENSLAVGRPATPVRDIPPAEERPAQN